MIYTVYDSQWQIPRWALGRKTLSRSMLWHFLNLSHVKIFYLSPLLAWPRVNENHTERINHTREQFRFPQKQLHRFSQKKTTDWRVERSLSIIRIPALITSLWRNLSNMVQGTDITTILMKIWRHLNISLISNNFTIIGLEVNSLLPEKLFFNWCIYHVKA